MKDRKKLSYYWHSQIFISIFVFPTSQMHLSISTERDVFQVCIEKVFHKKDVISGKVESSHPLCFLRRRLIGYISLEIVMTIDSQCQLFLSSTRSSRLFPKSKVIMYQEEREVELNPERGAQFSFSLRPIEEKLGVCVFFFFQIAFVAG